MAEINLKLISASTEVGRATTAFTIWNEQLHDWTDPATYERLIDLARAIETTARTAYVVAHGWCLRCEHDEHQGECGASTGNHVYDTYCRCRYEG